MPLMQINHLTHFFGGLRAVYNFNTTIEMGDLQGLIGPNGAGKTTIFNLVTGVYKPTEGEIIFEGRNIVGKRPNVISTMGIARTFQNLRLWSNMTVLDNVKIAAYSRIHYGLVGAFLGGRGRYEEERKLDQEAYELLKMLDIYKFRDYKVSNLPYGMQRRVEIARALMVRPKLLLLDEPAAGMSPAEMLEIIDVIRMIQKELGLAIWLIEHRMKMVMELCHHIKVLNFGEIIAEGTPEEIQNNPVVIKAYLGTVVT